LPIVDSHTHASTNWFEPVETLLHQMDTYGVEQAVLVQDNVQPDNSYQFECVRRYPGRFANVVMVDPSSETASAELDELAHQGASGVRLAITARSPGDDPLAIWRTAERLGLSVSCYGRYANYLAPEFAALVEEVPGVKLAIEHLGSGGYASDHATDPNARARFFALARYPNVYVKVPGLGEFAKRILPPVTGFPFERPIPPIIDMAFDSFGPGRMMWGSDYSPVSIREGYSNALRCVQEVLGDRNPTDIALVFGGTALSVFPIRS
jgi:L-fuconolactonase